MVIIDRIEKIAAPYPNAVITIGNFDGVHRGHRTLFQKVIEKAKEIGGRSVVMTFEPHPIRVLKKNGQPPLITLYEQKMELIEKSGIDVLICIHFTPEFASLTAREFVEDLLLERIGMKAIVVGEDYTFGKNRDGDISLLRSFGKQMQFEVIAVDKIQISGELPGRISSTKIRELVIEGKVDEAQKLLGRHYQIRGVVVSGRDRGGKLIGYPTANVNLLDELCPKTGIYAVRVECGGKIHNGVANIGYSPTFGDHAFTVEVHILNFSQDIYNKNIRVNFIKRIRDEIKFENISELSTEIGRDVIKAQKILAAHEA
jgi:riboflavin kinase / FMN adenylyltransferase